MDKEEKGEGAKYQERGLQRKERGAQTSHLTTAVLRRGVEMNIL